METSKPAWILLQNAFGLILGFLTYLLILRDAGVSSWGIFSTALSFGLIFSFVSDLGINTAHTRMIALGKDRNEYNNALIFMKIFLTLAYIGVIFLAVYVWTVLFHQQFQSPLVYLSILLLIPYFLGLPYIQANRAFFTGTQEAFKMSLPAIIESVVRFTAVVILIHFNVFNFPNAKSGIPEMAILIAISYSISYVVYFLLSFVVGMPWKFRMPHIETMKTYLKYSYPLMGAAITKAISANIPQVLVYIAIGSFASGGFAADYRFILMMTGFTMSVTVLILPSLTTRLDSSEDYGRTMGVTVKYLTIFVTPITVFATVFAAAILNLWNSALIQFAFALQIMLIGSWFWTMSTPYWTHFNAIAKTRVSGILNNFGYTLWIVLDVVLIPHSLADIRFAGLGVIGAAYAYLISGVVILVSSIIALNLEVKVPLTLQSIKGGVISVLLGALFYYLLEDSIRLHSVVLIGLFLLYSLAYVGLLIVSRTISREELMDILNMLNLKKLWNYAVGELRNKSQ
ncbi:MAG: oligosaccharide flippase family protein [Thermoplasmatales archaeon]|jgi:O-antigen/teichoic acid export membrane protein